MDHHCTSDRPRRDDERVDEVLALLTGRHCRRLLQYFRAAPEKVAAVRELADEISNGSDGRAEEVAIQLRHSTLPRLEDAGVIDYDRRTDMVRYQGCDDLEALLEAIQKWQTERMANHGP